jgi:hypothetical protein
LRWRFGKDGFSLLRVRGRDMRAVVLSALLLAGLVSQATAQLAVGPIAINTNVNGVPITISATSWTTVNSADNELIVNARILADLIDLQKKFSDVVGTFKLPANNCASQTADKPNPVVSLKTSSLWPRSDQLVMFFRGHVDVWSCVAGGSNYEIQWQKKKIGFINMKVPVLHTWAILKKNKENSQQFDVSLPIHLVNKDNATVALEIAKPAIKLEGQNAFVTKAVLKLANVDINKNASTALQSAIDTAKLKTALPKELQKLNMSVVSARFRDEGGHAMAEINLVARVSGTSTTQFLQQISANPLDRIERADSAVYPLP